MTRIGFAIAVLGLLGWGVAANATPIPIYNTGTNSGGSGLATPGSADPNWVMTSAPTAGTQSSAYVDTSIPAWATNPNSQWLTPNANGSSSKSAPGMYYFQTSFDLVSGDLSTAILTGKFAVDNCVTDVLINGVSTGIHSSDSTSTCASYSDFQSFMNFSITTGFTHGINTLTFEVKNSGGSSNAMGLNVIVSGTISPIKVPEPGALGLLGLAMLGFGGLWLRRRGT